VVHRGVRAHVQVDAARVRARPYEHVDDALVDVGLRQERLVVRDRVFHPERELDALIHVLEGHGSLTRTNTVPWLRLFLPRRITCPPFELFEVEVLPSIAVKLPDWSTVDSMIPMWSYSPS